MSTININQLDLIELVQLVLPDLSIKQNELDNPNGEFISLLYQQFRNKIYLVLSNAVKDVEPDEGKRTDGDNIYSLIRFINFTTPYIYPSFNASMTFKLIHYQTGRSFKAFIRPLLEALWSFESEFTNFKEVLYKRFIDSKKLQTKRLELDNLKKKIACNVSEIATSEKSYAELQKNNEKVQMRFKKLGLQQDAEKLTSEKLKQEVKSIVEEHDNMQVLVTNIKANIQHLNKQIVTEDSCKRLLSVKESLNSHCMELKNEETSIQENLRGKKVDIERFNALKSLLTELDTLAKSFICAHEQYSEQLGKHKQVVKNVQEMNEQLQKLRSSKIHLNEKIKVRKESIQNTKLKNTDSIQQLEQELLEIKQQVNQEKENIEQQLRQKRNFEKVLTDLNKSCVIVKDEINNLNVSHKLLYQNMIKLENANTENLSNALSKILMLKHAE